MSMPLDRRDALARHADGDGGRLADDHLHRRHAGVGRRPAGCEAAPCQPGEQCQDGEHAPRGPVPRDGGQRTGRPRAGCPGGRRAHGVGVGRQQLPHGVRIADPGGAGRRDEGHRGRRPPAAHQRQPDRGRRGWATPASRTCGWGPDGVFQNRRSPATYLNADRQGTRAIPPEADPTAEPEWEQISTGQVARWHDHRTHWMGGLKPPGVQSDPDRRQTVAPWEVVLRQGDTELDGGGHHRVGPRAEPLAVDRPGAGVGGRCRGRCCGRPAGRRGWSWPCWWRCSSSSTCCTPWASARRWRRRCRPRCGAPCTATCCRCSPGCRASSRSSWRCGATRCASTRRSITALIVALVGGVGDISFLSSTTLPFAWSDEPGAVSSWRPASASGSAWRPAWCCWRSATCGRRRPAPPVSAGSGG